MRRPLVIIRHKVLKAISVTLLLLFLFFFLKLVLSHHLLSPVEPLWFLTDDSHTRALWLSSVH